MESELAKKDIEVLRLEIAFELVKDCKIRFETEKFSSEELQCISKRFHRMLQEPLD